MNKLNAIYEDVAKCNKCGFCQAVCPIFRETRIESSVARGRLALIREAIEGKIPFNTEFKETLYECLLCKRCVEACPAGVESTDILLFARESLAKNYVPLVQKLIFNHFLLYPNRVSFSSRLLRIYQKSGLRAALKKTGLIGLLGPLAKSEDVLPEIPPTFRDLQPALEPNPSQQLFKVSFFLGCGTNILKPSEGISSVNTLRQSGCQIEIPEAFCCGLPALSYGHKEVGKELAKKNIDILLAAGSDYIVSDCASCSCTLKDYPKLFEPYDPYLEKATQLAGKIVDYAQLLLIIGEKQRKVLENQVVTYHEPCHLGRGLEAAEEPRRILKNIQGITFVEMPEADACCGAAGSYFVTHPELSEQVLRRKMENIKTTGANVVVTSCPACAMQLEHGARLCDVPVKIMHLAEVINQTIGQGTHL